MSKEQWVQMSMELEEVIQQANKILKKYGADMATIHATTEEDGIPMILGEYETWFFKEKTVFYENGEPYRRLVR